MHTHNPVPLCFGPNPHMVAWLDESFMKSTGSSPALCVCVCMFCCAYVCDLLFKLMDE